MGKIEELLTPDERLIKKQDKVQLAVGEFGMPWGDLYLTNKRLIFLVSKGWSIGFSPGAGLGSKDLIFPFQDIKSVSKSLGYIKVKTDKEYQFSVSVWNTGSWADAIQQAIALHQPPASQPPPIPPPPSQMQQPPQPGKRFCPNCGNTVKPEARFCESCGTKLQ